MRSPAPAGRRVFVDTSAYFALAVPQDANHHVAQTLLKAISEQALRVFTTNFVLAETHALILARRGRAVAGRVLDEIESSNSTIVRASARDERRAREIIHQYDDKDFSLTDAISFGVMERLHIAQAFAFDRNFTQYGFIVLTPDTIQEAQRS